MATLALWTMAAYLVLATTASVLLALLLLSANTVMEMFVLLIVTALLALASSKSAPCVIIMAECQIISTVMAKIVMPIMIVLQILASAESVPLAILTAMAISVPWTTAASPTPATKACVPSAPPTKANTVMELLVLLTQTVLLSPVLEESAKCVVMLLLA